MIADAHYAGVQDTASSQWQRAEGDLPHDGLSLVVIRHKNQDTLEIGRWIDGKYKGPSTPLINLGVAEVIAWMEVPIVTCL